MEVSQISGEIENHNPDIPIQIKVLPIETLIVSLEHYVNAIISMRPSINQEISISSTIHPHKSFPKRTLGHRGDSNTLRLKELEKNLTNIGKAHWG